ncbi:hypothetical protein PRVXH_000093 [Proteinivorax hydrogeniformans]|uniref:Uncharacterized protein n=1 Tax=Proteinivorax hydrogeniformans TaxID=1826727 RepID=A0AAU8HTW5_9FIRM
MFNKRVLVISQKVSKAMVDRLTRFNKDLLMQCVSLETMSTIYIGKETTRWGQNKNLLLLYGERFDGRYSSKLNLLLGKIHLNHQVYPRNMWSVAYRGSAKDPLKIAMPFTKFEHIPKGIKKVDFGSAGIIDIYRQIPDVYSGEILVK